MAGWIPGCAGEEPVSEGRSWMRAGGLVCLCVLLVIVLPLLAPRTADMLGAPYLAPGNGYPLGTDALGRDIFSLLLRGTRVSLLTGLAAAMAATVLGTLVGAVAGYYRGPADALLMCLTDVVLLIPALPLVIVLVACLGPGLHHIILVIALTSWPATARVVRSRVLSLRESAFVVNARSMGAGDVRILLGHILPNTGELVLAKGTLAVGGAMLTEAGVSFLGLGAVDQVSWGTLLHDAFVGGALINGAWWWYVPPLCCISISLLACNLAGRSLLEQGGPPPFAPERAGGTERPGTGERTGELVVRDLMVGFASGEVLRGVDLDVAPGEKVAVVGETGSGKSLLLLSLLGLLPGEARSAGKVFCGGRDLELLSPETLRDLRGREVAYCPQGAGKALNPVLTVGMQVSERGRVHHAMAGEEARREALRLLRLAGLPRAETWARCHPHQLSGGMKQRVLLAQTLCGDPRVLLADEPTKGLDPGSRDDMAGIFAGMDGRTVVAVTHDLIFAEGFASTVVVLLGGLVVEQAPAAEFFRAPVHPYSRALMAARPGAGLEVLLPLRRREDGAGCPLRGCCPRADGACGDMPPLVELSPGHRVRCRHHAA